MAHESSRAFRELIRSEANRKRLQYHEYLKVNPVLPPNHVRLLEELERREQVRAAEQTTVILYGPTALRSKARPDGTWTVLEMVTGKPADAWGRPAGALDREYAHDLVDL